jgi:hypothetical protein
LLVDPQIVKKDDAGCHIWWWRSLTDKRVCRATLQAEAQGLISGTEMGDRPRAIVIADAKGMMPDQKDWERVSTEGMKRLRLSDCDSLVAHLTDPKNERIGNVRLSIDIQGLKQVLWKEADGTDLEELQPIDVAENAIKWTDTSCMIVDCLTKKMQPDVIHKLRQSGRLSLKPTPESVLVKMRKRKQRRAKTAEADSERAEVAEGLKVLDSV